MVLVIGTLVPIHLEVSTFEISDYVLNRFLPSLLQHDTTFVQMQLKLICL